MMIRKSDRSHTLGGNHLDEADADILEMARQLVMDEGLPGDGPHLDLALRALIRGTEIGVLDSVQSRQILGFSQRHDRLHPYSASV